MSLTYIADKSQQHTTALLRRKRYWAVVEPFATATESTCNVPCTDFCKVIGIRVKVSDSM